MQIIEIIESRELIQRNELYTKLRGNKKESEFWEHNIVKALRILLQTQPPILKEELVRKKKGTVGNPNVSQLSINAEIKQYLPFIKILLKEDNTGKHFAKFLEDNGDLSSFPQYRGPLLSILDPEDDYWKSAEYQSLVKSLKKYLYGVYPEGMEEMRHNLLYDLYKHRKEHPNFKEHTDKIRNPETGEIEELTPLEALEKGLIWTLHSLTSKPYKELSDTERFIFNIYRFWDLENPEFTAYLKDYKRIFIGGITDHNPEFATRPGGSLVDIVMKNYENLKAKYKDTFDENWIPIFKDNQGEVDLVSDVTALAFMINQGTRQILKKEDDKFNALKSQVIQKFSSPPFNLSPLAIQGLLRWHDLIIYGPQD